MVSGDSETPAAVDGSGMRGVNVLLARARVLAYSADFDAAGYDDLPYLLSLHGQPERLALVAFHVGFKPGHAARFQMELGRFATATAAGARAGERAASAPAD